MSKANDNWNSWRLKTRWYHMEWFEQNNHGEKKKTFDFLIKSSFKNTAKAHDITLDIPK